MHRLMDAQTIRISMPNTEQNKAQWVVFIGDEMAELKFDTEGITDCPMNGRATQEECLGCKYYRQYDLPWGVEIACIYEDVFPELKDFAGLEDCIYSKEAK